MRHPAIAVHRCQIPAQIDGTNGMGIGTQAPTLKYGVISPFHAGGGGGGGGAGGGGRPTQVLDGASYTVPNPHSVALPTAGEIRATEANGAIAANPMTAHRRTLPFMWAPFGSHRARPVNDRTSDTSPNRYQRGRYRTTR
ncbi:hypothetical protein MMON_17340 [Mycolicibacterium monacense]|uniref:Uncharacterized protein n=1 Tax=Mycolicibacterium monacense TaxID=85693 RepID=A0AAD1IUJ2_MYCMB|nr:hypothetical protein MMON_17340 [Mycolicibacterium monacense]